MPLAKSSFTWRKSRQRKVKSFSSNLCHFWSLCFYIFCSLGDKYPQCMPTITVCVSARTLKWKIFAQVLLTHLTSDQSFQHSTIIPITMLGADWWNLLAYNVIVNTLYFCAHTWAFTRLATVTLSVLRLGDGLIWTTDEWNKKQFIYNRATITPLPQDQFLFNIWWLKLVLWIFKQAKKVKLLPNSKFKVTSVTGKKHQMSIKVTQNDFTRKW